MKRKVLYLFLSLMLMSTSVSAQTVGGRIAGVVIDDFGEEPLPGCNRLYRRVEKGHRNRWALGTACPPLSVCPYVGNLQPGKRMDNRQTRIKVKL